MFSPQVCLSVTTILPLLTNATPYTLDDFAFLVIILLAPYLLVNSIVCFRYAHMQFLLQPGIIYDIIFTYYILTRRTTCVTILCFILISYFTNNFSTYFIITASHLFALQAIAKHIEEHQHNQSELCADNNPSNGCMHMTIMFMYTYYITYLYYGGN